LPIQFISSLQLNVDLQFNMNYPLESNLINNMIHPHQL